MPAVDSLLFAGHREHQRRRVQTVDVDGIRHLHGIEPAQTHAAALRHRRTEHEFRLLDTAFARKGQFGSRGIENAFRNAERVIAVKRHFFLHLVLDLNAFRHLERHALFLELRKRLEAFGADRQREEFRTGLFGL